MVLTTEDKWEQRSLKLTNLYRHGQRNDKIYVHDNRYMRNHEKTIIKKNHCVDFQPGHATQIHMNCSEDDPVTANRRHQHKRRMYYSGDIHIKHKPGGITGNPLGTWWDGPEIIIICTSLFSITEKCFVNSEDLSRYFDMVSMEALIVKCCCVYRC